MAEAVRFGARRPLHKYTKRIKSSFFISFQYNYWCKVWEDGLEDKDTQCSYRQSGVSSQNYRVAHYHP